MASSKSRSRNSSKSPKQNNKQPVTQLSKAGDGGVKLPADVANSKIAPKSDQTNPHKVQAVNATALVVVPTNINGDGNHAMASSIQEEDHTATLSAGATTFLPYTSKPVKTAPAPISYLNHDSTADEAGIGGPVIVTSQIVAPTAVMQDKAKGKASQEPIGTRGANFSPSRPRTFFTTDVGPHVVMPGSHYVKITNIPQEELSKVLLHMHVNFGWLKKVRGEHCAPPSPGSRLRTLWLSFDDIRDAHNSFEEIQQVNTNWNPIHTSQVEYAFAKKSAEHNSQNDSTSFYDGQVIFTAQFGGLPSEYEHENLFHQVQVFAAKYGDLLAIEQMDVEGDMQIHAEYYSIKAAKSVVAATPKDNPTRLGNLLIHTRELQDCGDSTVHRNSSHSPSDVRYAVMDTYYATPRDHEQVPGTSYYSPTGRTAWRRDERGHTVALPAPKQLPKTALGVVVANGTPPPRHMSEPQPQTPYGRIETHINGVRAASWSDPYSGHQAQYANSRLHRGPDPWTTPTSVDVDAITNGQDVRTTVMLRNLPNNIDYEQLKVILDDATFGKYDFSYLRIDFANNLNVGYGFVNFIDPMHIVTFVQRFVGHPWMPHMRFNKKRGPRIADVSYATVQGLDCLIEKFRNSSVMDEFPNFRPKLWHTYLDPDQAGQVGTEKKFPEPNNVSKHQRSRDNATTVGLYQSAKGKKGSIGSSRDRYSQYDRGTPAQLAEASHLFHQNGGSQMSPLPNGYGYVPQGLMLGAPPLNMGVPPPSFSIPAGVNGFDQFGFPYNANAFSAAPSFPNGHHFPNGGPVMSPYHYGAVQFTDPFVNGGFPATQQMPIRSSNQPRHGSIAPGNGSPPNGYHGQAARCGVDFTRIPKAIKEERSGDLATYNNNVSGPVTTGQAHNGNGNTNGGHHANGGHPGNGYNRHYQQ